MTDIERKVYGMTILQTILWDICFYGIIMGIAVYVPFYLWYVKVLDVPWIMLSPIVYILLGIIVRLLVRYCVVSIQHWWTKNNMAVDHTLDCTEINLSEFIKIIMRANRDMKNIAVCDEYIRYSPDGDLNNRSYRVIYFFYSTGLFMVFNKAVRMCEYYSGYHIFVNSNERVASERSIHINYVLSELMSTDAVEENNKEEQ